MSRLERSLGPMTDPPWHALAIEQVSSELCIDPAQGLTDAEAAKRLAERGPNRLAEKLPRAAWRKFLDQFRNFLVIVLIGAAMLAGMVGDLKDAIVIAIVVLLNATLGFFQEHRAEAALAALKNMLAPVARVRRDSQSAVVAAEQLVPGDLAAARGRRPYSGRRTRAVRPCRRGGGSSPHRGIPSRRQDSGGCPGAIGARGTVVHGLHEHCGDARSHRGHGLRHRHADGNGQAGGPAGGNRRIHHAAEDPARRPRERGWRSLPVRWWH